MKNDERVRWRAPCARVCVWRQVWNANLNGHVKSEQFCFFLSFHIHTKTERLLFTLLKASFKDETQPLDV